MWLQLESGTPFELDKVTPGLQIDDIAGGLAKINRFSGATRVPYSVAQHSVHVSKLVKRMGGNWLDSLAGLLHDAHEIAIGDIPTPARRFIEANERKIGDAQRHIEIALMGSPLPGNQELVHQADMVALATERRDLMAKCDRPWDLELPHPDRVRIKPLGWRGARRAFLERYRMLAGKVLE